MRWLILLPLVFTIVFAGRFGIGVSGGAEYDEDYQTLSYEQLPSLCYGAEFHLQAEALPYLYLEPTALYLHDARISSPTCGIGLRVNVSPKFKSFPIAPFFGIEGTLLFYNDEMDLNDAVRGQHFDAYLESSSPRATGSGFGGLSIYFGRSVSLDCQYRYLRLAESYGLELAWAGITYYINW
jgi:hypothetical protein